MAESIPVFGGSMAESYDRYLVPILFEPYAHELAVRLANGFQGKVLELACGTGCVTRQILAQTQVKELHATDLSEAMLQFAQAKVPPDPRLVWRQANALELPFENNQFDAVVCQFGAMFFPDKVQAFQEAKRVLRDGGKLIFSVWAEMHENPVFDSMEHGLQVLFPDEPRPILPTPSNMADPETVLNQLQDAGMKAKVDQVRFRVQGFPALDVYRGFALGTPISTFLKEHELSVEDAEPKMMPAIAERLGDPLDTSMLALVFEAE